MKIRILPGCNGSLVCIKQTVLQQNEFGIFIRYKESQKSIENQMGTGLAKNRRRDDAKLHAIRSSPVLSVKFMHTSFPARL